MHSPVRSPRRGDVVYKEGRRPMAVLLAESFPLIPPDRRAVLLPATSSSKGGWVGGCRDRVARDAAQTEADGIKMTVVSTDRDAFQLVSDNVALMTPPRGVRRRAGVHARAGRRRYGIKPERIPDFIGLKGDNSEHPRHSRHRRQDRRAAGAHYGLGRGGDRSHQASSRRRARRHVIKFADQAYASRKTSRRCGAISTSTGTTVELVLQPPDRSPTPARDVPWRFRVPEPAEP